MSNYWECMELSKPEAGKAGAVQASVAPENPAHGDDSDRRYKAFNLAHDIRKFEIELFWKRGTYFWAFILAAFTGHFAAVNFLLKGKGVSLDSLCGLTMLSMVALCVTSFFCFFFSFAWVLMNKGSKYWQKNWEAHIDEMEGEFSGNLYETILNSKDQSFQKNPFTLEAYDYSVTKITMMTSIVLTIAAAGLFLFNATVLLFHGSECFKHLLSIVFVKYLAAVVLVVLMIVLSILMCSNKMEGNTDISYGQLVKWVSRKK
ncbi:MAG: hypothetical protein K2N58_11400 [Treponemataceae bacterium]|nr:hypothetical protein [Treponemataceae bacterium]